ARLVMAEIRLRHYIGEFFGQQRDQRHYVGLLHRLRALCPLATDHDVDRHGAISIIREINGFQRVKADELLIDAGPKIEGPTIAAKSVPGFAGGPIMPTENHNSVSVQVRPATAELRPTHIPLRRLRASQPRSTNRCARYPTICQNQSNADL